MSSLAYMLIGELHCPVIDKTGLAGNIDLKSAVVLRGEYRLV